MTGRRVSVVTHSHYQHICSGKVPSVYLDALLFIFFLFFIFKRGFFSLLGGSNSAGKKNLYSISSECDGNKAFEGVPDFACHLCHTIRAKESYFPPRDSEKESVEAFFTKCEVLLHIFSYRPQNFFF